MLDTPERRAAFEARLETLLTQIGNARVRDHYRRDIKNRMFALWRERPARKGSAARAAPHATASGSAPPLPSAYGFATVITLALINHPWLLDRFAEEVATLEIRDRRLAALLGLVTSALLEEHGIGRERLVELIEASPHAKLFAKLASESVFARVHFVQPSAPREEVEEQFADLIFRFRALPALSRELAEGADQLSDLSEAEFERFAQLQRQVASAVSRDVAEDFGDQVFNDRFAKKIAEVMREKGAWKPGRRPEKYR